MHASRPDWVASRVIDGEAILYNLATNKVLTLNEVGSAIWAFIPTWPDSQKQEQLNQQIARLYELPCEHVRVDVDNFLAELFQQGFIVSESPRIASDQAIRAHFATTIQLPLASEIPNIEVSLTKAMAAKNHLYAVTLELTQKCNEKCMHCYAIKDNNRDCIGELSTLELKGIIDELREIGCLYLVLTGGEALFRKDFFDIYEYARDNDFVVDIYTNGLLLDGEKIDRICSRYPRAVYLSIYSMNADMHDHITRVQGSLKKTVHAVRTLRNRGINVVINITVFTINANDYSEVIKFAEEIGAGHRLSFDISPKSDGNKTPIFYRVCDKKKVLELFEKRYDGKSVSKFGFDPTRSVCNAGAASLSISATGEVYPCLSLRKKLGNVRERSIRSMWLGSEERRYIRDIKWKDRSDCHACEHKEFCSPCMGISDLEHGELLKGNAGDCFNSECRHEFYLRRLPAR